MSGYQIIDSYKEQIIESMQHMIAIPAISPESGGEGESKRADFLGQLLKSMGFEIRRFDYIDGHNVCRSSVVCCFGNAPRTLWVIAHIDTVSAGDINLWKYDPFKGTLIDDRIFGRGTNDDGQDVIAGIYALKALKESNVKLKYNYGLALVADEEVGSEFGIEKLINEGIFKKDDMIMVPDSGNAQGSEIEIAEKSMLWLKITIRGKQVHASIPDTGVNAFRYMSEFSLDVYNMLHSKYNKTDNTFIPNASTFEMTKHEKNQESINMIPETEIFYIDCRILPEYKIDDIMSDIRIIAQLEKYQKVKIDIEPYMRDDAPMATSESCEIVKLTKEAIKKVINVEPYVTGIGGGTFARFFRAKGIDAVVWSKKPDIPHIIDEYVIVDDILTDAKVFYEMVVE